MNLAEHRAMKQTLRYIEEIENELYCLNQDKAAIEFETFAVVRSLESSIISIIVFHSDETYNFIDTHSAAQFIVMNAMLLIDLEEEE